MNTFCCRGMEESHRGDGNSEGNCLAQSQKSPTGRKKLLYFSYAAICTEIWCPCPAFILAPKESGSIVAQLASSM